MTKYLLIFIGLFTFQKIQSQSVFCPPGAEWHYLYTSSWAYAVQPYYNEKIKYTNDSIIGLDTVKILRHKKYYSYYNTTGAHATYIKQKGDTVFMKNLATRNLWQVLYNYGALAGQTWTTVISSTTNFSVTVTYTISVDSTATTNINNYTLKKLFVKYRKSGNTFAQSATIIERIGCTIFMFNYANPSPGSDGDIFTGCICYQDSAFGLKQFSSHSCDYSNPEGLAENNPGNTSFHIYPNPANEFITIEYDKDLTEESVLGIYDFSDREVKRVILRSGEDKKIAINGLPEGLYLLKLKTREGLLSGKLVKNN